MQILIRNIRVPISASDGEVLEQAKLRLLHEIDKKSITRLSIFRRSIDTRHKTLSLVYSVLADIDRDMSDERLALLDCGAVAQEQDIDGIELGSELSSARPVVVGFGPCGMFAALVLAQRGYRPIVIERGDCAMARAVKVNRFFTTGKLDTESNIQFGAGGAGTFSDGKLVTRINDSRCRYVLETLVRFGAPRDVLVNAKPHIGTDKLLGIVANIGAKITELGGEIRYNTKFIGIEKSSDKAVKVLTDSGQIECGQLILAIGHSSRDTYEYLIKDGFNIVKKPFSVGVRIEHLTSEIDKAIFRDEAGNEKLGHAEYALSKRVGEDCVYTFCMCPGGEVVAAASEEGGVVTNGMSRSQRDGVNSNCAIAVNVDPDDPIEFQRRLERAAFEMGGGGYTAPMQTVGDFLSEKSGSEPTKVSPTYMGGNVKPCDLSRLFPQRITSMLRLGIKDFGGKIKGFDVPYAILTGVETRTSAPVRILRNENMNAIGYSNIYPCGEGAGYAGGITSAAVDGIRCAEEIIRRYAPFGDTAAE